MWIKESYLWACSQRTAVEKITYKVHSPELFRSQLSLIFWSGITHINGLCNLHLEYIPKNQYIISIRGYKANFGNIAFKITQTQTLDFVEINKYYPNENEQRPFIPQAFYREGVSHHPSNLAKTQTRAGGCKSFRLGKMKGFRYALIGGSLAYKSWWQAN